MRTFTLLLFYVLSFTFYAQSQNIKGIVQDVRNQPVPFATVALLNAKDSSLVKANVTSDRGVFEFLQIKTGSFVLQASSVGYATVFSKSFIVNDNSTQKIDLTLTESSQNLAEVKVVAKKPLVEVLADKMVFNVEGSINASGSNALELLQKSPNVVVDQNDNVMLQGRSGVRIYLDGKPSPLSMSDLAIYLRSLPSDQIEAIEIIAKPSAKYDAAGNAGIINIRLKKNKNFGTNGSATLGLAQGAYFPKFNGSLTLNHRTAKANWFGTYSHRNSKDWSFINFNREQGGTRFDQRGSTDSRSVSHNLKTGADFFLNKKNTLGFLVNANFNDRNSLTSGRTSIGVIGQAINSVLVANNRSTSDRFNGNANLNYRFADTTGHELSVDADYGRFNANGSQYQPNRYLNATETQTLLERNYRMNTLTNIQLATFKADYEQKLWGGKLGAGFKIAQVRTDNNFDFFDVLDSRDVLNANRTNQFIYVEKVNAAYVSFGNKVKKIGYQLGLRLEQTNSKGTLTSQTAQADAEVKRNYLNLFPSAGLTYDWNAKNSFALNYSRRIDRPTYQDLNPFESKLDELTYSKGNAFLRPEYSHNVELSHTHNYALTTSLSYSRTTDVVAQLTDTIEVNRNFIGPRNIASNDNIALNVSYPFAAAKWWNVYFSGGVYHTRYRADFGAGRTINLNATAASFYAQNTFTLSPKLTLEVSGFYSSPSIWGGTYQTRSIGNVDLGLQSKVLKGQGNLKLTLSDVFFTQPWRGTSEFGGLRMVSSGGYESRQIRLNFTYNFGNKQVKSARQRQTGAESEKGRIGG